jgi:hypothetical protein
MWSEPKPFGWNCGRIFRYSSFRCGILSGWFLFAYGIIWGDNKCRCRLTVYLIPGGTYETCIQIVPARLISTLNSSGSMLTLTLRPPVIKEMYHISFQSSGTLNHNHERFLQKRLLSNYEFEKMFYNPRKHKSMEAVSQIHIKLQSTESSKQAGCLPTNSGVPLLCGTQKHNAMCTGILHSNLH